MKINKSKLIMLIVVICATASTAWAITMGSGTCTTTLTWNCDGCGTTVYPPEIVSEDNHCSEAYSPEVSVYVSNIHTENMPITCLEYPECEEDNK